MELTEIQGSTPIKKFQSIYNSNNKNIINYIDTLEERIITLENMIESIKYDYNKKISYLNNEIIRMKSEAEDAAEIKYVDGYNNLIDKIDSL